MGTGNEKPWMGSVLIRSVLLLVAGLLFIPLGLITLPALGIVVGVVLIGMALYPWFVSKRSKKVEILVGSVTDNYLNSQLLPVAILSSSLRGDGFDFDPSRIDPDSIRFGPLQARPAEDFSDPLVYQRSLLDVNGDGVPDLVLYFSGDTAGITSENEEACLVAKTLDGERIFGCGKVEYGYEKGLNELLAYR